LEFELEMQEILLSIPFGLFIAVLLAASLYWWGGRISAKGRPSDAKIASYACGEELPSEKLQVNLQRFFVYAVYFMIFDILAFMLATSLASPGRLPAAYALVLFLAIAMLLPLVRQK